MHSSLQPGHAFRGQYRCSACKRWHPSDVSMVTVFFFDRTARFCNDECLRTKVEIVRAIL